MNKLNESELTVITRAKECCTYVLNVTDLAPKKYRYTLVSKMQMYALDVIESLYMANCIRMVKTITDKEIEDCKNLQDKAMTKCRLLGFVTAIAREVDCITPRQHRLIIDKVFEIQRMLYSWQQSDINRLSQR